MITPKFSLFPQFKFQNLVDIKPDFFRNQGITFIMIDLDNTIAAYSEDTPSEEVLQWFQKLRDSGIKAFLISNSKRSNRVDSFAKALETAYLMNARKPSIGALNRSMGMAGVEAESTALIGDQIFTDVLAANRAGVVSVVVHPKRFTNPFLAIRYFFELPFRKARTNKSQEKGTKQ